jgi:hypothetical protein
VSVALVPQSYLSKTSFQDMSASRRSSRKGKKRTNEGGETAEAAAAPSKPASAASSCFSSSTSLHHLLSLLPSLSSDHLTALQTEVTRRVNLTSAVKALDAILSDSDCELPTPLAELLRTAEIRDASRHGEGAGYVLAIRNSAEQEASPLSGPQRKKAKAKAAATTPTAAAAAKAGSAAVPAPAEAAVGVTSYLLVDWQSTVWTKHGTQCTRDNFLILLTDRPPAAGPQGIHAAKKEPNTKALLEAKYFHTDFESEVTWDADKLSEWLQSIIQRASDKTIQPGRGAAAAAPSTSVKGQQDNAVDSFVRALFSLMDGNVMDPLERLLESDEAQDY